MDKFGRLIKQKKFSILSLDTDGDGVVDSKDCRPFDPKRQDIVPNEEMQKELKNLPIYVTDTPGKEYQIMSKEAKTKALVARTEFLSAIHKYPYILSDIRKSGKKYVHCSVRRREDIALGIRKGLIQDIGTRRAILGSETERLDALQPFVNRFEQRLGEIGMDAYSMPSEYKPKTDMLPKIQTIGTTPFGLKDYDKTYHRHSDKISKAHNIPYTLVVDKDFSEDVIFKVEHSGLNWLINNVQQRGKLMPMHIRKLRIDVKWATQYVIQQRLMKYSYPKSWQTAFYVSNFAKINKLMEKITQRIVKDFFSKSYWQQYGEYNKYEIKDYY